MAEISSSIRVDDHKIITNDDTLLHTTLYCPPTPNDRVVVIASALGVQQTYYRPYACYLAQQGFAVLTLDYRGIGASKQDNSLRGNTATLRDWGAQDLQASLHWVRNQYPANKIFVIGHSIGGSLLGLADDIDYVDGLLGVAAQTAYWGYWPAIMRPPIFLMWHLFIPVSSHLAGYFPSGLFGMGDPVPRDVGLEWAAIGRTQDHLKGIIPPSDNHFNDLRAPLALLSFTDDRFAPKTPVDHLEKQYPNGELTLREHIHPSDVGAKKIGHMGFFREAFRETLWQQSAAWLLDPQQKQADAQAITT